MFILQISLLTSRYQTLLLSTREQSQLLINAVQLHTDFLDEQEAFNDWLGSVEQRFLASSSSQVVQVDNIEVGCYFKF